jgi:hypothetical protein
MAWKHITLNNKGYTMKKQVTATFESTGFYVASKEVTTFTTEEIVAMEIAKKAEKQEALSKETKRFPNLSDAPTVPAQTEEVA